MTTRLKTLIRRLTTTSEFDDDQWEKASAEYLPIVPSARLWLPRLGVGDDGRFARIFRDTWRKIPLKAKRLMVKHWRKSEPIAAESHLRESYAFRDS